MHRAIFEASAAASEQAQLWVGPEAAMFDPLAKEFVLTGDPNAGEVWIHLLTDPIFQLGLGALQHDGMSIRLAAKGIDAFQALDCVCERFLQAILKFLICIQTKDPVASGFVDRRVFLPGVALP